MKSKTNLSLMDYRLFLLALLCAFSVTYGQTKKTLQIKRAEISPVIDGVLDDAAWNDAAIATDFIQFRPEMGVRAAEHQKTIVRATYDDKAVYFSAYCFDNPDDIVKQYSIRDNFGQTDFLAVVLNPNNDAQNDALFFVFPSGTQADAIASPDNGEDFGWDAVWESAVQIVEDGWIVEYKIPYAALRFSNQEVQTWGIQFHRHFRSDRSQFTWNPLDVTKGNIGLYHGELRGLENIEPPVRLSLYPFTSGVTSSYESTTETQFNIGLDLKYGITENFTLDATLIPDFSQAGFDNVTLNLGPFEQIFSEQRQFFKEGVDLFNKGNLFFSRRIGSAPIGDGNLSENEKFINYPDQVKTLNAVKVSGRTKNGLGVGVFNAITERTEVTVENVINGDISQVVVEPLANYNVLVFDQQFNKNSSVSLINTNVTRNGDFRDANVTGLLADITNKKNTFNFEGEIKMSSLNLPSESVNGYSSELEIKKVSGQYRYGLEYRMADRKYDINDMGLLFRNNFSNFSADISYRTFEPSKKLNNYIISSWFNLNYLFQPSTYTGNNFGLNFNAQTKKLVNFGANINGSLGKQYDYFEPRTEGRFFIFENWVNFNSYLSTDYNKLFAINLNAGAGGLIEEGRDNTLYRFGISPRFRFSDKFFVRYSYNYSQNDGGRGFVTNYEDEIVFGQRDQLTITNSLSGSYTFNSFHALNLTFRNYWSTVDYQENLFTLLDNGRLSQESGLTVNDIEDPNINFNTWNLDLSYSWQFAPGSILTALYRNQLFNLSENVEDNYFNNLSTLFNQSIQHTFSLRMVYFIDYNNVKGLFANNNT